MTIWVNPILYAPKTFGQFVWFLLFWGVILANVCVCWIVLKALFFTTEQERLTDRYGCFTTFCNGYTLVCLLLFVLYIGLELFFPGAMRPFDHLLLSWYTSK